MKPLWRSRVRRIALLLLLAVGVGGCFNPFSPRLRSDRGTSTPPPVPSSARGVVELFQWCWNNRAYQEYTEIFTDDFRFQFSARDTAGQAGRGEFLDRAAELETARHLFLEGSATEPPARSITLEFAGTLTPAEDGRDGKMEPWHQQIVAGVHLRIDTGEQEFNVEGLATFYLVRGDSALIPTDTGLGADSTRWWIERWEDATDGESNAAAAPRLELLRVTPVAGGGRTPVSPERIAALATQAFPEFRLTWTRLKLGYLGRNP